MEEFGTQVRRRPRRHEPCAHHEFQPGGDFGCVTSSVEAPHHGAHPTVVVAGGAVVREDGLDVVGERRAVPGGGQRHFGTAGCGGQGHPFGVHEGDVETQGDLIGGANEPEQLNGPYIERGQSCRSRRLEAQFALGAGGGALKGHRRRGLLHGEVPVDGNFIGGVVVNGVGKTGNGGGCEAGEGKLPGLEEVVADPAVPQRLVRGELAHVHHDVAEPRRRRVAGIEGNVTGDAPGGPGGGGRHPGEDLLNLVGDL